MIIFEFEGHRSSAVRAYKRTSTKQEMRVSDILYGLNVRKKAKLEESCEDEKWAQEETVEIDSVNKNQNRKQAGDSTTTEENKIQKENTDQEIVAKAPINISFNFVLK